MFVTLSCQYKNSGLSVELKTRQKAINYFFQVYGVFTERTEEPWNRAPAVGDAAAEPVPGGRGTGDGSGQSVRHP